MRLFCNICPNKAGKTTKIEREKANANKVNKKFNFVYLQLME